MAMTMARSRFIRLVGWCGYAVLLGVTVAVRYSSLPSASKVQLGDLMLYLLPVAMACVLSLLLGAKTSDRERRLWFLIAGISACILASETYFTWYTTTVDPRGPPAPGLFQLLQVFAFILGIAAVVAMTSFKSAPVRSVMRFCLDVFAVMVVLAALCYRFFILPLFENLPAMAWQEIAALALYPAAGLTIVGFMAVGTSGWRTYRWRSWERLIAASFTLFGASLILTPVGYYQLKAAPDPQEAVWSTGALGFGYYVLFMAILYRFTTTRPSAGIEPWIFPGVEPKWAASLYPIGLAAMLPALGIAALRMGDDPDSIPLVITAVALAVTLVLRSWLRGSERVLHRRTAITDAETGLFNYRYLGERLANDVIYAREAGNPLGVVTVGLEAPTDASGGSRFAGMVADALKDTSPRGATICRTSVDSFVVVVNGLRAADTIVLAHSILEVSTRRLAASGLHAAISVGVAIFPEHGADAEELLVSSSKAQSLSQAETVPDVVVYDVALAERPDPSSRLALARRRSRRSTTRALAAVVDARDPDTHRHSENVADLASALALVLDLPPERTHVLDLAAQMHDVGKIGIRDETLRAKGVLTSEQRQQVEEHAVLGERILAAARLDEILPAVRHHHERWDGAGYPDGLSGADIPLEARILAVCDSYESMTKPRTYEECLSVDDAIIEVERCAGSQFDPDIAAAFVRMIQQVHGTAPRDRAGGRPTAATRANPDPAN